MHKTKIIVLNKTFLFYRQIETNEPVFWNIIECYFGRASDKEVLGGCDTHPPQISIFKLIVSKFKL